METARFQERLEQANFNANDKIWLPRWISRFASAQPNFASNPDLSPETVISFLRSLLRNGVPAWQRLQAVRALQAWSSLILNKDSELTEIRQKLVRLANQERADSSGAAHGRPDNADLIGIIDSSELEIIQRLRARLRKE